MAGVAILSAVIAPLWGHCIQTPLGLSKETQEAGQIQVECQKQLYLGTTENLLVPHAFLK